MAEFTMPSLGADMDEGTVVEWLVRPGDAVRRGDVVAVVDTAKAAVEVECFDSGTVAEILVPPGRTVPVGTALALIDAPDDATSATRPAEPPPATEPVADVAVARPTARTAPDRRGTRGPVPAAVEPAPESEPTPAVPAARTSGSAPPAARAKVSGPLLRKLAAELGVDLAAVRGSGKGGVVTRADVLKAARRRITPHARKLAAEMGVDLTTVTSTRPDGVIRASDVRAAAPSAAAAAASRATGGPTMPETPPEPTPRPPVQVSARAITAQLMARSKREIPHYYLSTTIDLRRVMARLREVNRDLPVERRLLPIAFLLSACARAARQVPQLNGFWLGDHFEPAPDVDLGVAVSLRGGGLITPVLPHADELSSLDLMDRLRDVVARARRGRLRAGELTTPSLTVTNLGERGVESVFGVIYPPQVALVGLGKVVDRPWAVDGLLGVRPVVTTTLSADHRATDGHTGARFLETVDHLLTRSEEP